MALPPGVTQANFDRALRDFEKAVGELLRILRGKPGYEARRPELKALLADLLG